MIVFAASESSGAKSTRAQASDQNKQASAATRTCWVTELVENIVSRIDTVETLYVCLYVSSAFRQTARWRLYEPEMMDQMRRFVLEECLSRGPVRTNNLFTTLTSLPPFRKQLEEEACVEKFSSALVYVHCAVTPLRESDILQKPTTLFMRLFQLMPHIQFIQSLILESPRRDIATLLFLLEGEHHYCHAIPNRLDFAHDLRHADNRNQEFLRQLRKLHAKGASEHGPNSFIHRPPNFPEDMLYLAKFASRQNLEFWRGTMRELELSSLELQLISSVAMMDGRKLLWQRQAAKELQFLPLRAARCRQCAEALTWVNRSCGPGQMAGVSLPLVKLGTSL